MTTRVLLRSWAWAALLLAACEPAPVAQQPVSPTTAELEGSWRYDSTGVECYSGSLRYLGGSAQPMRAGAILTIGARSWAYSGSLHEVHDYTRTGRYLLTRRIGTPRMVRAGYISPEHIGQPLGHPKELEIFLLTPQRLILRGTLRDTINLVNGYCKSDACRCVWSYYYSR